MKTKRYLLTATWLSVLFLSISAEATPKRQPERYHAHTPHPLHITHSSRVANVRRAGSPPHQGFPVSHPRPVGGKAQIVRGDARRVIIIDPGHGGTDPGAISRSGTLEKTITLATANQLRHTLERTGRFHVLLTRTGDQSVTLSDRLAFVRRNRAALLVSIHADASPDHSARGASVYVSSGFGPQAPKFASSHVTSTSAAPPRSSDSPKARPGSAWLQYTMIDNLADDIHMTDAPARRAHFYILAEHDIPSVLVETGFLSNRHDEKRMLQAAYREVIARAIRNAIEDYFNNLKTAGNSHT
jgi:N-acetylmuramoyl-L-alanine amidase